MIIFVGGLVGAGKSTIAKALAEHYGLHYYDVDELKREIYPQDPDFEENMRLGRPFRDETRQKLYKRVIEDLVALSAKQERIVVDETLHRRDIRAMLFDAAEKQFGSFIVIWVYASEPVIMDRLTNQVREGHMLKDPVAMHQSFLDEFQNFRRSTLMCRNDGTVEESIASLTHLIDNMGALRLSNC